MGSTGKTVLVGAVIVVIAGMGIGSNYMPTDSTDASAELRSDMVIFNDYGTGLQYLGSRRGGLTPRLDADGRHMTVDE